MFLINLSILDSFAKTSSFITLNKSSSVSSYHLDHILGILGGPATANYGIGYSG
jgi:hypothetical protein